MARIPIAVDADDVLLDTMAAAVARLVKVRYEHDKIRRLHAYHSLVLRTDKPGWIGYNNSADVALTEHVQEIVRGADAPAMPNARHAIEALSAMGDVYIVSSRPSGTEDMLIQNLVGVCALPARFDTRRVLCAGNSSEKCRYHKGMQALVIDDMLGTVHDVGAAACSHVLFEQPWNRKYADCGATSIGGWTVAGLARIAKEIKP